MTETKIPPTTSLKLEDFAFFNVGRLGAQISGKTTTNQNAILMAALDMAERRILRLEMALRRAGIEVEETELPS